MGQTAWLLLLEKGLPKAVHGSPKVLARMSANRKWKGPRTWEELDKGEQQRAEIISAKEQAL